MKEKVIDIFKNSFAFYSILLLVLFLFTLLFSFNGLYGQDAYEYLRYTNSLRTFLLKGITPGEFYWPLMYPVCGSLLSLALPVYFSLQLISMAAFILSIYFLEKIILNIYGYDLIKTRLYLLLFYFLSPFLMRSSIVIMSDMLSLLFMVLTFYFLTRLRKTAQPRYFPLLIATGCTAVMTRYAAVMLLAIPLIFSVFLFLKKFNFKYLLLAIPAISIPVIPHILTRHHVASFLSHPWLTTWDIRNFFMKTFFTDVGAAHYVFPNILYAFYPFFHPGFLFVGILFIFMVRRKHFQQPVSKIIFLSVFLYLLFLAGIPLQSTRFEILSFPLVVILFAPAGDEALNYFYKKKIISLFIPVVILIQLILFARAFIPFYRYNYFEKYISEEIKKYPDYPVYTLGLEGALKSYGVENKIIGLHDGQLEFIASHSLLLFNENKTAGQWNGTVVMKNVSLINQTKKVTLLKQYDDGWQLRKIE